MPRVTIIIPTYNWATVLPYSIGSVLDQTFTDFELLVVGDCCTDESEQVVEDIAAKDPRVRWINLETNAGEQSGPNNEGLRQAKGEIIAYLGHDDLWLPRHLERLVNAIDAGADLAYGIMEEYDVSGTKPKASMQFVEENTNGMWLVPGSVAHRAEVTKQLNGWRYFRAIDDNPDTDLWERARKAGFKYKFVPHVTGVKFPAVNRKDAYKRRECREQKAMLERIRSEPDFEHIELVKMLATTHRMLHAPRGYRRLLGELYQTTYQRIHDRLFPRKRGKEIDKRRKFKGLDKKK